MSGDNNNGGGNGGADNGGGAGGGANNDKPWHDGVDAETLGYLQNRGLDKGDAKAAALAAISSHRNAEKMLGAPANEIIRLPKDPNDKAWSDVRVRLGAGKEPKDYDFVDVKFADGTTFEPKFADFLKTTFHREGVPKTAAVTLAREFAKYIDGLATESGAEEAATIAKERDALTKNWGSNYRQNLLIAENAAKKLGISEDAMNTLARMEGVGYAAVTEMMLKVGQAIGEDRFIGNGDGSGGDSKLMTVAGAKERLAELKADKAWVARVNGGDLTANRELDNLAAIIASGRSAA